MEHVEELNNNLSESDFIYTVLNIASQIFTKRQKKYLEKTRMVKLVALTADRLNFPLTRGWFRYGIYAPKASLIISSHLKNEGNLENLPNDMTTWDEKILNQIKDILFSLIPYFMKPSNDFDKWIHEELSPTRYKAFYKYESIFFKKLNYIQTIILQNNQFGAELSDFSEIITNLGVLI